MNSNADQPVFEHTNDLSFDDDSTWLLYALLRGSLVIVHDGSFRIARLLSSFTAVTLTSVQLGHLRSKVNADCYRGEWLDCVGALQVLLAVLLTSLVLI